MCKSSAVKASSPRPTRWNVWAHPICPMKCSKTSALRQFPIPTANGRPFYFQWRLSNAVLNVERSGYILKCNAAPTQWSQISRKFWKEQRKMGTENSSLSINARKRIEPGIIKAWHLAASSSWQPYVDQAYFPSSCPYQAHSPWCPGRTAVPA